MNQERFRMPANRQIIEEAAEWFVLLSEGDADHATRERFHDWLSRSPEHVQAYLKILPMWEDAAGLDTHANDRAALIAWGRAHSTVIPLKAPAARPQLTTSHPQRHRRTYAVAASVTVLACASLLWGWSARGTYSTDIGEQRIVALSDGSSIELNSRSRVRIRFDDRERSIELLKGQALFKVAKDAARPFIVRSDSTSVRAVGTQFDVYRKRSGTVVTVIEGRVAVASRSSRAPVLTPATPLSAGEQLTVSLNRPQKPKQTNVAVAVAWTQQQLVFFRTPLPEVAEEFNRYNRQQLVIKDDSLTGFNVSGTFSSTNPDLLIRFLKDQSKLKVEESGNEVSVSAR